LKFVALLALTGLAEPCWAETGPTTGWVKVDQGRTGSHAGSVLLWAPDMKQMLLVGPAEGAAFAQAFDPSSRGWSDLAAKGPTAKEPIHPYYQAAYDPGSRTVYCLSGGAVLYALNVAEKTWKTYPPAAELEGLSWQSMACDTLGHRLVVVGADKKGDNLGWSRTVVYDTRSGKWSRLEVGDEKIAAAHRELVAAKEATIDLVGRIRLAWYRDPRGIGAAAELQSLAERCRSLAKMPQMTRLVAEADAVLALLGGRKTLDALKAARALQYKIEQAAEAQYPAPCARRNAPLAFDAKNGLFVLFGGDHEDYLMNDTWVLDLGAGAWRRCRPQRAPTPRAGHALCGLPKRGGVALYEGYVQSSSSDYGANPYKPLDPVQLWIYDPKADRWDLVGSWPLPVKEPLTAPAPRGFFDGYAAQWFCPPALAATADDSLLLAAHACGSEPWRGPRPCETWMLALDRARADAEGGAKPGAAPNVRRYRDGVFQAAFCEVAQSPKETGLDRLPANRWVRLPDPPRNPLYGCRQRDWGTCVWDPDRDQILHWGGGHCVRSASTVAHYSPVSGRIVEGFDADEPYSHNGGGGSDCSLLGRPWVSTHNYNHYAYDPKCKLLVSGRGYLYDPDRMDWLRMEPIRLPFTFAWGETCVKTSPHGAVAWARKKGSEHAGLWLFDRQRGWIDLEPKGQLFTPYCDAHGMVYDSKRDRMILSGVSGGYSKTSNGQLLAFDFKTKTLQTITPENSQWAKTHCAREMVYVEPADWIVIGELYPPGEEKGVKRSTRVYDCGKNAMFLLDAGDVPDGYSTGWMYDAKRGLVYVFTYRGEAWALKPVPAAAR
jgi:hypothetical protein